MTLKRDSKYTAIETALESIRLGDPHDPSIDSVLVRRGLACWIGGDLFITQAGREWLGGNR